MRSSMVQAACRQDGGRRISGRASARLGPPPIAELMSCTLGLSRSRSGGVHMRRVVAAVMIIGIFSGCATTSAPSGPPQVAYPLKHQSPEQQRHDETACQAWARQQTGYDPGTETAKGAGVGALVGALGGAAAGAAV